MDDTCREVYVGYLKQRRDAGASLPVILSLLIPLIILLIIRIIQ